MHGKYRCVYYNKYCCCPILVVVVVVNSVLLSYHDHDDMIVIIYLQFYLNTTVHQPKIRDILTPWGNFGGPI